MALDANLFTLVLTPVKGEPSVIDLVDPQGEVHYRKRLISAHPTYQTSIFDPHTDALLCTVSGTNPTAKQKTIELFNPNVTVSFQYTGTLSFKWSFTWEENDFEWKKEACFLVRKPDPPVIVCSCDAPQSSKRSALQILDYNLQRFDISDRKGLEICIIAGLLSFYDQQEEYASLKQQDQRKPAPANPVQPGLTTSVSNESMRKDLPAAPAVPIPRDGNEVFILDDIPVNDYVHECAEMLKDESILYIVLRAQSMTTVPKCVQVAEATKRFIYRTTDEDGELHQYVTYDEKPDGKNKGKSKHRINLDVPAKDPKADYVYLGPPQTLTIHLSKIPMPELQPKAAPKPSPSPRLSPVPPSNYTPPVGRPPSPGPMSPKGGKLHKPAEKGKRAADPSPEPKPDKGKGKERADVPAPEARPDKGKGREQRPISMLSPNPANPRPDKGKGRPSDNTNNGNGGRAGHQPSPSVPVLKIDTSGKSRPPATPANQRPQSYHAPGPAPGQQPYRPPPSSQAYPLPPGQRPPQGAYLQPQPMGYQGPPGPPGQGPYRPQSSPVPQQPYLTPYAPGMQPPPQPSPNGMYRVPPDNGPSMFDKFFRTHSR